MTWCIGGRRIYRQAKLMIFKLPKKKFFFQEISHSIEVEPSALHTAYRFLLINSKSIVSLARSGCILLFYCVIGIGNQV